MSELTIKLLESRLISADHAVESSQSTPKFKLNDWDGKRMRRDWAWVDTHYNTLADKYTGQWIIVYDQKVRGAHRDIGIAQDQATADIGDIHKAGAVGLFVERERYVCSNLTLFFGLWTNG